MRDVDDVHWHDHAHFGHKGALGGTYAGFGRRGGPGGGPGGFGPGGPFGRRGGHGGRGGGTRRAPRGNVRAAILALLAIQAEAGGPPMHGYQMIQELSGRTRGAWQPSPGSIYPTLQLLEDEGLIVSRAADGKRSFELTAAGRAEAERIHGSRPPWEQVSDGFGVSGSQLRTAVHETVRQLMVTAKQVTEEHRGEILTLLADLREKLAGIAPEDAGHHHAPPWARDPKGGRDGDGDDWDEDAFDV